MNPEQTLQNRLDIETTIVVDDLNRELTQRMVTWILADEKQTLPWFITIVIVDDAYIIDMNKQFFSKATPTDVISFRLSDTDESLEGEIYISIETVKKNASEYSVSLENELLRVVAHGVYHLLNFDDDSPEKKRRMTELENKALEYVYSSF